MCAEQEVINGRLTGQITYPCIREGKVKVQAISPFLDDIPKEKIESLINSKQKVVDSLIKDAFK